MNKAFLFTLTTFFLIFSIMLLSQEFALNQLTTNEQLSDFMAGDRISHKWEDIRDSVTFMTGVSVAEEGKKLIIIDSFSERDIAYDLGGFEDFVNEYYTPGIEVSFHGPFGNQVNLEDINSELRISPQDLIYGYPNFAKHELYLKAPGEQIEGIQSVLIDMELDKGMNVSQIQWNPYAPCDPEDPCLNVSIRMRFQTQEVTSQSVTFNAHNQSYARIGTGTGSISITIGQQTSSTTKRLIWIQRSGNISASILTSILLNTTAFSTAYDARLRVSDPLFNVHKEDKIWLKK